MRKIIIISLLTFVCTILYSQNYSRFFPYFSDIKKLDTNYIHIPNNNYGFLTATQGYYPACQWTRFEDEPIVYEQGLFFIGKMNNSIYLTEAMWGSLYSPGPILNNNAAMISHPEDSLKYRVYKISKGDSVDTNIDVVEWPSEWGAPVSSEQEICLYADQMLWTIYNGLDSNCFIPIRGDRDDYPAFPLEVQQISYVYGSNTSLDIDFIEDVVFFEYTIINKGDHNIDSSYIGLWTDIDFYGENNFPAIDTTLQLGYCWSDFTPSSPWFDSSKIPAVGYIQLFGPQVPCDDENSTFRGRIKSSSKNLPISSFWGFHDDSYPDHSPYSPAYSRQTAWNIVRGYDKLGHEIIDPFANKKTNFRYSGDPVVNSGWLATERKTNGGAGFYLFSGPFNLAAQDTQWVMYALVVARGKDNLQSITELRRRASVLRSLDYSELVKLSGISMVVEPDLLTPSSFQIYQNYPNPFNNLTTIKFDVAVNSKINIDLYNSLGQKIYNLFNGQRDAGSYSIKFSGDNLASGVYFYKMSAQNFIDVKKLILLK